MEPCMVGVIKRLRYFVSIYIITNYILLCYVRLTTNNKLIT